MKAHLCHPTMLKNPLIVSFFCKIKSSVFTLTFQNHLESSPDILNSCPVPSPPRRPPVTFPYVLCHALSLGACPSLSWESPFSSFSSFTFFFPIWIYVLFRLTFRKYFSFPKKCFYFFTLVPSFKIKYNPIPELWVSMIYWSIFMPILYYLD